MLRLLVTLALNAGLVAVVADALLRRRRGSAPLEPLRMLVIVDAPIERVWEVVSDVPAQPRWMHEMKSLRILDDGPVGPGTRAEATVRMFGISITDPVVVETVEPPTRYAIRHEGLYRGGGVITLEATATGEATIVRWEETLIAPLLPDLVRLLQGPLFQAIFQQDLHHLKTLIETGETA